MALEVVASEVKEQSKYVNEQQVEVKIFLLQGIDLWKMIIMDCIKSFA